MEYIKVRKNKKYLLLILIGIFLIVISISFHLFDYINEVNYENINQEKIEEFFEIENKSEDTITNETKLEDNKQNDIFMAVLEIPKINLKRGIYDKSNINNNVDKNIFILNESILPSEEVNSHILLASHSGNSYISYFRNLYKLNINDKVYFYYQGIKYIYEISDKYEIEKTGTIKLSFDNHDDITLITCINNTNKQLIYRGILIEKIEY